MRFPHRCRLHIPRSSLPWILAAALSVGCTILPLSAQSAPSEGSKEEKAPSSSAQAPAGPARESAWELVEEGSYLEIGYRWVSNIGGNRDMYRSMVNLGDGPKLLRSAVMLRSKQPGIGLFDRFDLSMDSWGGEPYNTMRLRMTRQDLYEFRADYRNLNYYNFIPTWSNPLLATGRTLGQHSLNVTQRMTDLELKLFPAGRVRPFVGYSRNSGFGPGFTTYGPTANEFLLDTRWSYTADTYRGGVELSLPRTSLVLEQGYRFLRNDSAALRDTSSTGNTPGTFIGQPIVLNSLNRSYHDRTELPVSKVLAKIAPFSSLMLTGRYVYAMADTDSEFSQVEKGSFVSLEDLLFYRDSAAGFDTRAKSPSHRGDFLLEWTPLPRLWLTNETDFRSYHISGGAILATTFLGTRNLSGQPTPTNQVDVTRLESSQVAYDQVRNQAEAEFEIFPGVAVRGGHRYTHVEAALENRVDDDPEFREGSYTQQTALGGVSYRHGRWLKLAFDFEANRTDRALTRTSLLDHDRFRVSWRFRPSTKLSAYGSISLLHNDNRQSDIDYDSHNRSYNFAVDYAPVERLSLSLDYSRTNIYSDLFILLPHSFQRVRSLFDERSHGIGGRLGIEIYQGARVDFGYRGVLTTGNLPINYHQPFLNLTIPLGRHLAWKTYWQYYGYNEKATALQDYRGHLITFAIAIFR